MIAVRTIDFRNDFKKVSEIVNSGEKVLISRPHNQNLVVLTEKEYNALEKLRRNTDYLLKIEESRRQIDEGDAYTFTMDELLSMENMTVNEMQAFAKNFRGLPVSNYQTPR